MLPIFVILFILSILALVTGFVWVLVNKGETSHRQGAEVGAEMMSEQFDDDEEGSLADKTAFRGKAKVVEREASISFKDIKQQVKSGNWQEALPLLLAVGGFLGLLVFGSLALFFALDDKLVGGLIAIVVIFTVARILIQMARA